MSASDQSVVLLPCPFCGSTELNGPHINKYVGDSYSPSWWVDCEKCPGGMEVKGEDVQGLVDAWNKRAKQKCVCDALEEYGNSVGQ